MHIATQIIEQVVADFGPDFHYTPTAGDGCRYVHHDEHPNGPSPGCLVAQVLVRAGVPVEDLEANEGITAASLVANLELDWPLEVRDALREAQYAQDTGSSWGEALAIYHKRLEGHTIDPGGLL